MSRQISPASLPHVSSGYGQRAVVDESDMIKLQTGTQNISENGRSAWYALATSPRNSKKSKAVPLHAMQALGGEEVYVLLILDLGSRWGEWSASPTLPRGKDPRYPLYWRLGGPQSQSGH
jgi:hypothetical protein